MTDIGVASDEAVEAAHRQCTCHPDDNPPIPCPRQYALTNCRAAAYPALVEEVTRLREALVEIEQKDQHRRSKVTPGGWTISETTRGPYARIALAALTETKKP